MKISMKQLTVALAAAALMGAAGAATETGTLTVNATVTGACAVGDATLTFNVAPAVNAAGTGSQSVAADVTSATDVSVVCTNGQNGTLSANDGVNADVSVRRLSSGTAFIPYGLYTDSGYATAFNGVSTIAITGTGTAELVPIYGKIDAADATAAPKGTYSDSVLLTITYGL